MKAKLWSARTCLFLEDTQGTDMQGEGQNHLDNMVTIVHSAADNVRQYTTPSIQQRPLPYAMESIVQRVLRLQILEEIF